MCVYTEGERKDLPILFVKRLQSVSEKVKKKINFSACPTSKTTENNYSFETPTNIK